MTESSVLARDGYDSAADYAYAALREGILDGRYAPGRRMREVELASLLGISRTPTRLALSRLENDGLIELRPRAGLVVASLDAHATEELYEMRAALEGTAAALAARHASARDLDALQHLVAEEAALPDDPAVRFRHNRVFHHALYQAAHNRFLMKSLQALHDSIALLGPTTMRTAGRAAAAQAEHQRIVEAIVARNADAADRCAQAHVVQALAIRRAEPERAGLRAVGDA